MRFVRLLEVVSVGAIAIILYLPYVSVSQAQADAYVRMQSRRKVVVAPDGLKVVITSWGEHAIISKSITQNGLTRFAMVSENVQATTNIPLTGASGGQLITGYLIGCQFPESNAQIEALVAVDPGEYYLALYPTPSLFVTTPATVKGEVFTPGINLMPGTVSTDNLESNPFVNGSSIIQIFDTEITAQTNGGGQVPCAGYAQARSFQRVIITGAGTYTLDATLYGQAFGIG